MRNIDAQEGPECVVTICPSVLEISRKTRGGQKIPPSRARINTFDYILNTLALGAFFVKPYFWSEIAEHVLTLTLFPAGL